MEDQKNEVENALKVFHYEILEGKGKISHKQAVEKAENEYEKYKVIQDKNYVSDFDRLLSKTKQILKQQFHQNKQGMPYLQIIIVRTQQK